jgi:hypothetical protein
MGDKAGSTSGGRYAGERYEPKVPACARSGVTLRFTGKSLLLEGGGVSKSYPAVSGKKGAGGFDYSAERQAVSNAGPIPEGRYWINPKELWERAIYKFWMEDAWGDYRITIHPYPDTKTHKRGGFFIHGGKTPGSAGCVDLTKNIDRFVDDLKAAVGENANCFVPLEVRY